MAKVRALSRKLPPLEERFEFIGDAIAPGDQGALRSAIFEVEDGLSGVTYNLKLWQKTDSAVDGDLRQLWLHEMRQIQRVMSYAGARDVIVDVLEFVEDEGNFGVLLQQVGKPLASVTKRAPRHHWLKNLGAIRSRVLFWRNIGRLVKALGIVHAQGLVHGKVDSNIVMTEGAEEPDFYLSGFEWSLWLSADSALKSHALLSPPSEAKRAGRYSFEEDWQALGHLVANCLGVSIKPSGDVEPLENADEAVILNPSERSFLRRLIVPAKLDVQDVGTIALAIEDILTIVNRSVTVRAGTFLLALPMPSSVADAIYLATDGEVPIDDFRQQLSWIQADLAGGATLTMPRTFEPKRDRLSLVTEAMVYSLSAFQDEGAAVWDIAYCSGAQPRGGTVGGGLFDEHPVLQPITVAGIRKARELRSSLGPDVLDWSAFASPIANEEMSRTEAVQASLVLVQIVEAVVKAFEIYPIEVLDAQNEGGRRYVTVRALPRNDRDGIAKRINLPETSAALNRLFAEEHRDAESQWRISLSTSLGASRAHDVVAAFVDVVERRGGLAYRFEVDDEIPSGSPLFLRPDGEAGTEQVIGRHLANIRALDTRVDLAEMLDDPWRLRRTSRDVLAEDDANFEDLDEPKQRALRGIWSTLPSFFVVGPPGVGKTKLATELIWRRFVDPSTRMLLSAQGHDALDNLQEKVKEALTEHRADDVIVVRSSSLNRKLKTEEDVQRVASRFLQRLAKSKLVEQGPAGQRERIKALAAECVRIDSSGLPATRSASKSRIDEPNEELRSGLRGMSNLVLDGANIVISPANSGDIERLVEAREQFDWVIVEEAAKATGPELVGPMMLSGRRLLIGDHHQLPPFGAERIGSILKDHALVEQTLDVAEQFIGSMMRDGELDAMQVLRADAVKLRTVAELALRLLEPFRTFVEEDEKRLLGNPAHRRIAATLTEQRRMDPAIAEIISNTFYHGKLLTERRRRERAETELSPIVHLSPLPASPVVVVDFPHVSSTGRRDRLEFGTPRWHNPSEISAVVDVLKLVRAREGSTPTLAILSPYKAQVEMLTNKVTSLQRSELAHLSAFRPVRQGGSFVGTVDSFQGSEADLVIISFVRNNPRSGGSALGFLRDQRRMNVALSRAKSKLIIVGSLSFLKEAVRGVNPDEETHSLTFLSDMVGTIERLTTERRGEDLALASIIHPENLRPIP